MSQMFQDQDASRRRGTKRPLEETMSELMDATCDEYLECHKRAHLAPPPEKDSLKIRVWPLPSPQDDGNAAGVLGVVCMSKKQAFALLDPLLEPPPLSEAQMPDTLDACGALSQASCFLAERFFVEMEGFGRLVDACTFFLQTRGWRIFALLHTCTLLNAKRELCDAIVDTVASQPDALFTEDALAEVCYRTPPSLALDISSGLSQCFPFVPLDMLHSSCGGSLPSPKGMESMLQVIVARASKAPSMDVRTLSVLNVHDVGTDKGFLSLLSCLTGFTKHAFGKSPVGPAASRLRLRVLRILELEKGKEQAVLQLLGLLIVRLPGLVEIRLPSLDMSSGTLDAQQISRLVGANLPAFGICCDPATQAITVTRPLGCAVDVALGALMPLDGHLFSPSRCFDVRQDTETGRLVVSLWPRSPAKCGRSSMERIATFYRKSLRLVLSNNRLAALPHPHPCIQIVAGHGRYGADGQVTASQWLQVLASPSHVCEVDDETLPFGIGVFPGSAKELAAGTLPLGSAAREQALANAAIESFKRPRDFHVPRLIDPRLPLVLPPVGCLAQDHANPLALATAFLESISLPNTCWKDAAKVPNASHAMVAPHFFVDCFLQSSRARQLCGRIAERCRILGPAYSDLAAAANGAFAETGGSFGSRSTAETIVAFVSIVDVFEPYETLASREEWTMLFDLFPLLQSRSLQIVPSPVDT